MQKYPSITILLAAFNGADHIAAQLASLAAQDHTDWALWVSDDGSTDATCDLVRAFAQQHPTHDIRLLKGPQNGAAANFLHLLCHPDLAVGHVALCDQDDIWRPEKLRLALSALHGSDGPTVYSAQSRHITASGASLGPSRIHKGTPSFGNALVQNRVAGHCATLNPAAHSLIRAAGVVDVPFHDWWIYMLVQGGGGTVAVSTDIVLDYRQHDGNVLGGNRRRLASLSRIVAVFGSTFRKWQALNAAALNANRQLLTTSAKTTLDDLQTIAPYGVARARALKRLGLVRDSAAATTFLTFAAFFGRI